MGRKLTGEWVENKFQSLILARMFAFNRFQVCQKERKEKKL